MTRLLTNLALGFSLVTSLATTTPTALAQSQTRMSVTIPFNFSADKVSLPAGSYIVETTSNRFLVLRNVKTNKVQTVMIRPDDGTANNGPTRLTFHRQAGQTYLAQVWIAGSRLHSELVSHPKPRREMAELTLPDATFDIATR